jgi:hypothetical protein
MKVAAGVVVLSPCEARPPAGQTSPCREGRPPLDVPQKGLGRIRYLNAPRFICSTAFEMQRLPRCGFDQTARNADCCSAWGKLSCSSDCFGFLCDVPSVPLTNDVYSLFEQKLLAKLTGRGGQFALAQLS